VGEIFACHSFACHLRNNFPNLKLHSNHPVETTSKSRGVGDKIPDEHSSRIIPLQISAHDPRRVSPTANPPRAPTESSPNHAPASDRPLQCRLRPKKTSAAAIPKSGDREIRNGECYRWCGAAVKQPEWTLMDLVSILFKIAKIVFIVSETLVVACPGRPRRNWWP
jgi:hypothetical protein